MGYYVAFLRTNYDSNQSLAWELTDKNVPPLWSDMASSFFQNNFNLPKFLKPDVVNIYPDL